MISAVTETAGWMGREGSEQVAREGRGGRAPKHKRKARPGSRARAGGRGRKKRLSAGENVSEEVEE